MNEPEKYPLISCICVTNNRVNLLKRSIACFVTQEYINKEIVVSYPETDNDTRSFIDILLEFYPTISLIRIERPGNLSVGNAHNMAIRICKGEYICHWDDDDWYHPGRLIVQYTDMVNKGFKACVLRHILLYDSTTENAYASFTYSWDNTILCKKEILLANPYADRNKGEDTHIMRFLDTKQYLFRLENSHHLYIYIYHGGNIWNYEHYKYFIDKSELLNKETTSTIIKLLNDGLDSFPGI
ncbi:glycosyltransferase family 2 protein [Pedobacter sp. AW31-3R]|uniref:glycosyltransferase family 2 protein n=1 Tax=Pedobacter sp. AW31-3R TaxID=3445781 RepID=UPI003F9F9981